MFALKSISDMLAINSWSSVARSFLAISPPKFPNIASFGATAVFAENHHFWPNFPRSSHFFSQNFLTQSEAKSDFEKFSVETQKTSLKFEDFTKFWKSPQNRQSPPQNFRRHQGVKYRHFGDLSPNLETLPIFVFSDPGLEIDAGSRKRSKFRKICEKFAKLLAVSYTHLTLPTN